MCLFANCLVKKFCNFGSIVISSASCFLALQCFVFRWCGNFINKCSVYCPIYRLLMQCVGYWLRRCAQELCLTRGIGQLHVFSFSGECFTLLQVVMSNQWSLTLFGGDIPL